MKRFWQTGPRWGRRREAKELGETRGVGALASPSRGTGPARKTNICSVLWPVGLSFLSGEARKTQWDPSLPGLRLRWSRESHDIGSESARKLGGPPRSRGILTSSVSGERRSFYPKILELEARDPNGGGGDVGTQALGRWPLMLTKTLGP